MPRGLNAKRHGFLATEREEGFAAAMEEYDGAPLLDDDGRIQVLENGSIMLHLENWDAPMSISPRLAEFLIDIQYPDRFDYADLFMEYVRETINQYDPAKAERRSDK